jgi:ABC-2 type transport system ATP-binding protein
MIQISSLSRKYGDFKAVDEVGFEIKKGEVVGLLGHNGAGKTTIMKMITGFLEPTSGEIRVDDLLVGRDTRAIQARIGYLPENCPVWPEMSVIDYLEYQGNLQGVPDADLPARVSEAIRRTALQEKATAPIQTLSRGYRQRVGVAQAILHKPDIIILDEPTNGLDPTQILQMRDLIRDLAKSATVILSTHILQEVQAVCERVLIMRHGKLVVDSRVDALQAGRQLRVTVNNAKAADYLGRVAGVSSVALVETVDDLSSYLLDVPMDAAPKVVAAVAAAGDLLYRLQPETRNLETVFAEVNSGELVSA